MKINTALLGMILKAHKITGQGYSNQLADNKEVLQEYIRAVNAKVVTAPVGPTRILIAEAITAVLSVGRLVGIEQAVQALELLQKEYGGIASVNFNQILMFGSRVVHFVSPDTVVLTADTIADALLLFSNKECRELLMRKVNRHKYVELSDREQAIYHELSEPAVNLFKHQQLKLAVATATDPAVFKDIDKEPTPRAGVRARAASF